MAKRRKKGQKRTGGRRRRRSAALTVRRSYAVAKRSAKGFLQRMPIQRATKVAYVALALIGAQVLREKFLDIPIVDENALGLYILALMSPATDGQILADVAGGLQLKTTLEDQFGLVTQIMNALA